jgi:predicted DCC family thiol-disulfide oxidoreductase YuxK
MPRRHILPIRSRMVLYDGGCGMCARSVTFLLQVDTLRRLRFADIDVDWHWLSTDYPTLDHDACLAEMHVITNDGRIHSGFDAFRSIVWVVPLAWFVLPFLYIPGIPQMGRRIYRSIAANRTTDTCRLGEAGRPKA